ncbi:hypothetical protein RCL1_001106 [Eukaryota sp. TZLM3-RCL]
MLLSLFRICALLYNLFEYLPKRRMPSSEDPQLKVPFFNNYLSLMYHPEMWQRVWKKTEVEKGIEVHVPEDLPAFSAGAPPYLGNVTTGLSTMKSQPSIPAFDLSDRSARSSVGPSLLSSQRSFGSLRINTDFGSSNTPVEPASARNPADSMLSRQQSLTKLFSWDETSD